MIPWNERVGYRKVKSFHGIDGLDVMNKWYSWLINDWIPSQPDSKMCMRLFIGMGFNPAPFLLVLRFGRNWINKWSELKAKGESEKGDGE